MNRFSLQKGVRTEITVGIVDPRGRDKITSFYATYSNGKVVFDGEMEGEINVSPEYYNRAQTIVQKSKRKRHFLAISDAVLRVSW